MVSRRGFLAGSALAGAGLLAGCRREAAQGPAVEASAREATPAAVALPHVGPVQHALMTRRGMALGGGRGEDRESGAKRYWLSVVDLDAGARIAEIPTGFFPHGIAAHPLQPHVVMAFEKHGKGCCQIDLRARRVTATVQTVDANEFYGHGAYSSDGRHFFCTETAVADGYRGLLVVRDSRSFAALGELPTGGKEPHDCVLINGGETLVVTNGGGHIDNGGLPSVTYVDVGTRSVLRTLRFTDAGINAGHVWVGSKGQLAIVSAPRQGLDAGDPKVHGALSLFTPGEDAQPRTVSAHGAADMRGEVLSVALHEPSMVVGATDPDGNLLSFWDFNTGRLLKSHRDLPGPRGIGVTLDQRYFVVTYGPEAALVLVDVTTLEPVSEGALKPSWMTGSHVVCHDWSA